jgi:hypothetical protein
MAAQKLSSNFTWGPLAVIQSGVSDPLTLAADYTAEVYLALTQVGTPTTPATVQIMVSPDGSTWYGMAPVTAPLIAGVDTPPPIEIPVTAQAVRIVYTECIGPTGVVSSCSAQLGQVIGV